MRKELERGGWWVARAAGSLGDADLIALKAGETPQMIEVKSTAAGPYHSFGPKDRAELLAAAERAGAEPMLVWWPPRKPAEWIEDESWPNNNSLEGRLEPEADRSV